MQPPGLVDSSSDGEPDRDQDLPMELDDPEPELDSSSDEETEQSWKQKVEQRRWFGRTRSPVNTETTAR